MLDKRKIDNLRDLLVGVVPNPIDQVKQITMALVYKFMNDMDSFNENFAGKKIYFVNDYAKYAWHSLIDEKLSNLERFHLYAEAIQALELNSQIPEIFQHIFKGAFLSYRNPETLTLFLREINGFDYNADSEQLGDAFEYLLSILGSQKDAGQFRTPRHIIDFIVKIIKPTKHDTILDPACGTAGFLISAFQYIRDNEKLELSEFAKVFDNIYGYDITPDMVKIALINLYLHGDTDPHIYEYDTLSSEDRWGDKFSCILANPPFMTPKGGIKPHKKFRIDATKSEVLFVDYILEHLRISGRAGIIVPEGIIFQSGNAYKKLRKMLVDGENGDGNLIAVISLPSGVFKPYSGVKTSILVVDKQHAKPTDKILLVKINNDGFDLGDKRTPITANDLPKAIKVIEYYQMHGRLNDVDSYIVNNILLIEKSVLASNDYNLSFDRYKSNEEVQVSSYPMVKLGDVCDIFNGSTPLRSNNSYWNNGNIAWFTIDDLREQGGIIKHTKQFITELAYNETSVKLLPRKTVLLCCTASVGAVAFSDIELTTNQQFNGLVVNQDYVNKLTPEYLFHIAHTFKDKLIALSGTTSFNFISIKTLKNIAFPLPPLETQQKIVAEIEQFQKVIDGAKLVVDNYKPTININPEWQTAKLSDVCDVKSGGTPSRENPGYWNGTIPWFSSGELNNVYTTEPKEKITESGLSSSNASIFPKNSLLVGMYDTAAFKMSILNQDATFNQAICGIKPNNSISTYFLYLYFLQRKEEYLTQRVGVRQRNLSKGFIANLIIPVPQLEEQQKIVAELKHERTLVDNAKQLIDIMQDKINQIISQIWRN